MPNQLRVIVADDNDGMRCSIVTLLCMSFRVVGAVSDGVELVHSAAWLRPDVIVSDVVMPRMDGVTARTNLIAQQQMIPFVFLSMLNRQDLEFLYTDSPVAFVHKLDMSAYLNHAVAEVHAGRFYLSPQYRE